MLAGPIVGQREVSPCPTSRRDVLSYGYRTSQRRVQPDRASQAAAGPPRSPHDWLLSRCRCGCKPCRSLAEDDFKRVSKEWTHFIITIIMTITTRAYLDRVPILYGHPWRGGYLIRSPTQSRGGRAGQGQCLDSTGRTLEEQVGSLPRAWSFTRPRLCHVSPHRFTIFPCFFSAALGPFQGRCSGLHLITSAGAGRALQSTVRFRWFDLYL